MRLGRGRGWAMAAVLCWLAAAARPLPAADPPRLAGETRRTAQRFNEAAALERQRHWTEAVELYLRLIDEAGDELVPSDADPSHLLPARALVHRRLAARPELLPPYRDRVEPRARRLLEQGESRRDPQPLEQLIDTFFCSRSAERALHLLGDLACERGHFAQARRYWHLLEPAASPRELAYPDPQGDPALPRAKQVLVRLLAGERAEAAADLRAFRAAHPDVTGHLAGRDGNFAAILQQLLDAPDLTRVPAPVGLAPPPTTFAGDETRNGVLAGMLPPFCPQPRYPAIDLPGAVPRLEDRVVQLAPIRPQSLAFHPVIARGQVFVADARRVTAYELATGKLSGQFDLAKHDAELADALKSQPPAPPGVRYTLTVDGDRLCARLGPPTVRPARGAPASVLVALQWRPEQATPEARLHLLWQLPAPKVEAAADAVTVFEGAPVVRDGRLYVAVTRLDGNRATTAIACYDADEATPGLLWQQDVYEAAADTVDRNRLHLLTLAGPNVVLCSHAGVIVALEAAGGRRAWAVRYPSRGPLTMAGDPSPRDLAPCVYADGRLYAAPADADRVHCLDATTGAPLWASDVLEVAHLLGVVRGRVVCTTGGFTAGLCALDAADGHRIPDWGYRLPGASEPAPFGRGLLCGDRVYWPTRGCGVRELRWDGTTAFVPTVFQDLPGGNLAYGEGCLVVATADRLHVLVGAAQEGAGPGLRLGRDTPDAADHLRQARIAADRGQVTAALGHFRAAERLAGPDEQLRQRARTGRHDLLLWESERRRRIGRPASDVRATLTAAAAPEFGPGRRLLALTRRADFEDETGRHEQAERIRRSLPTGDLRSVSLRDAAGTLYLAHSDAIPRVNGSGTAGSADRLEWNDPPQTELPADEPITDKPERSRIRLSQQPTWRIRLKPRVEWALLPADEGEASRATDCVLIAAPHRLTCRGVPDGHVRWQRPLAFTPHWLAVGGPAVIVAGAGGIARLSARDGRPLWQFRVPDAAPWLDAPGWRDPDVRPAPVALSGFRCSGGRLWAWLGMQSLVAWDAETGQLLWQRPAPPFGRFHPCYHGAATCAVVQTTDGRRWVLDAATGRVRHEGPAPDAPWPNPPLALDGRRLLVVEGQRLVALDRMTGRPAWAFDLPRWPSLSGEVPQTRLDGGVLLVGVARNEGYEVERLDPATGERLDPDAVAVGRERVELTATALDGDTLYVADGGELRAIDCRSSRVLTRHTLGTAGKWRIERTADGLLLWTVPRVAATEPPPRAGRLLTIALQGSALAGERGRLDLPRFGPHGVVRVCRGEVVVAQDGEIRGYRGAGREAK